MNREEKQFFIDNYEDIRQAITEQEHAKTWYDITNRCYVVFGKCGATVHKWKKSHWERKTVNYWKDISVQDFLKQFNNADWEEE